MPAAKRVDPKALFSAAEWSHLTTRSRIRGLLMVAHCWATIIAAGALAVVWPNPVTWLLAVMIIGARQLGLAILVHEAAHGQLHPDLEVNDTAARWLCAAPVGANLERYRPYHLKHHKFVQQAEDPDLSLSAPFPISQRSLRRKMIRDLTGQTFYKQRIKPTLSAVGEMRRRPETAGRIRAGLWSFWKDFLIANGVLLAGLSALGVWWAYPVLWLLPMATWYPLVTRIRNIAEHACVPANDDPFKQARTTRANLIERLLIAPYYVNYHLEHHLFMHLPCWRLPEAHRLLMGREVAKAMEVRTGYLSVLRIAAGATRDDRPGRTGAGEQALAAPFG